MNLFSIAQLSEFSGIKAHTIRIWEKRYQALQPLRSNGNTRFYDDFQLKRLLNIVTLIEQKNYKPSEVCGLTDSDLIKLLEVEHSQSDESEDLENINSLIKFVLNYDYNSFSDLIDRCIKEIGLFNAYVKIILPFISKVGVLWATDVLPPAKEHFASNILRQKIFAAINSIKPTEVITDRIWVLYLPEGEFHEIGLLFAYWLLKYKGDTVYYLGANVPLTSVVSCVEETKANHVLSFIVRQDWQENYQALLNDVERKLPDLVKIFVGKKTRLNALVASENTLLLTEINELENYLTI